MMSMSPAIVGVDLDTVQLTLVTNPVALRLVKFCRFCFHTRDPSDALTA